ncbi:hypothetical protein V5799_013753 [Amblyomma americanum]|uniref:Uncharacterized protein n=1 Tax=Amblyomma americanum TaxID=6943 RepID=A0AAQ4E558_AMBAM
MGGIFCHPRKLDAPRFSRPAAVVVRPRSADGARRSMRLVVALARLVSAAALLLLPLLLLSRFAGAQWFHKACPSRQLIGPSCQCSDKTKGLDVICERVERADRLRASLAAVADAQHPVLYLKIKEVRQASPFPVL